VTHSALGSRLGGADQEERLARAAAGGNARAFATLYRRYEERAFSLGFRLTGSAGLAAEATRDAFADALDAMSHLEGGGARFGSCLLIAVRNRSVELMAGEPDPEDEPEPADAFAAAQAGTRHAVLNLDGSIREVLALGSLAGLRHGGIATVMDVDVDAVPELSAAARLALHDELWGPDADLAAASEECAWALPLMALRDDGQLDDQEDRAWLVEHLAHCGGCRLRLDAMEQAQATYDRWELPVPPQHLFAEASAATGRFTEEDGKRGRRGALTPAVATAGAAAASTLATAGGAAASTLSSARAGASRIGSSAWGRRPWSDRVVTAGLVLVMLLGLSATLAGATLVIRGSDRSEPATPANDEVGTPTKRAPRVVVPPKSEAVTKPRKRKKARAKSQRAVVVRPPAEPEATPKREVRAEPQGEVPTAEAVPLPKTTPTTPEPEPEPAPTTPPARTTPEAPTPQPAPGTPAPPPAQ
jgi:DNA-directed RNA polymerase specialized sigma24 family protein